MTDLLFGSLVPKQFSQRALQKPEICGFTKAWAFVIYPTTCSANRAYIYMYIHNMYIHMCALFGNVLLFYVSINHNYQLVCLVFLLVSPVWIL